MPIDDNVKTLSEEINVGSVVVDPAESVPEISNVQTINMPDFLKAETGPGGIEEYMDHPLNFSKSKGLARVIRGLTGMLGSLNLAIIDIVVGGLEFMKERKNATGTI
jgi:hypothetical protein